MSSLYQAGNITKRSGKTAAKKLGEKTYLPISNGNFGKCDFVSRLACFANNQKASVVWALLSTSKSLCRTLVMY
jgi:hypothetical protein